MRVGKIDYEAVSILTIFSSDSVHKPESVFLFFSYFLTLWEALLFRLHDRKETRFK